MQDLPADIDATAKGLAPADVIFVFGTRLPEPALAAADLYHRNYAPVIVVTGGSARQEDGLNEAHAHRDLLLQRDVPETAIVVEDCSHNTIENVAFAIPLLAERAVAVHSAIAVVKRYHRRAAITLAQMMPSIERIYTATYDATPSRADRIIRERAYLMELGAAGVDLLVRTESGWCRS